MICRSVGRLGLGLGGWTLLQTQCGARFDRYDSKFGIRELVAAFVKVNIEDELYEQEDKNNTVRTRMTPPPHKQ